MKKEELIALYNELATLKIRYVIINTESKEILKNHCYNKRTIINELNTVSAVNYFENTLAKIVQNNLENNHNFDTLTVNFQPLIIIPEEDLENAKENKTIHIFKDILPIIMDFSTNNQEEKKYTSPLFFVDEKEFVTSLKQLGYDFSSEINNYLISNIIIKFPQSTILLRKKDA